MKLRNITKNAGTFVATLLVLRGLTTYLKTAYNKYSVAVIKIEGTILNKNTAFILNALDRVERENNPGLILWLDTPGGGVQDATKIYNKITDIRDKWASRSEKKKVYAYCSGMCCSAGIYIAMAADKIYADPMCTIGSIGVVMQMSDYAKTFGKVGVETHTFSSGVKKSTFKTSFNNGTIKESGEDVNPMPTEVQTMLTGMIDCMADEFFDVVDKNCKRRNKKENVSLAFKDAGVYVAQQKVGTDEIPYVVKNGIVEELATFTDFLTQNFPKARYSIYKIPETPNSLFRSTIDTLVANFGINKTYKQDKSPFMYISMIPWAK
tara:strand:+ start:228 stop:1193 length:966 start_codon:yes stop_codon:yes gene_type:complete